MNLRDTARAFKCGIKDSHTLGEISTNGQKLLFSK
jgi:hypothetical protein